MNPTQESFNVVIAGSWNPAIFSSDWVAEYLCNSSESTVGIALPLNNPHLPARIEFEDTLLFPQVSLIKLCPTDPSLEGLISTAKVAEKLIDLLPHTPLTGLGINLGFNDEQTIDITKDKIFHSDSKNLETQYVVLGTQITRSLALEDDSQLNLKLSYSDSAFGFEFNFHHNFVSRDRFKEVLEDKSIENYYNKSVELMKDSYGYAV